MKELFMVYVVALIIIDSWWLVVETLRAWSWGRIPSLCIGGWVVEWLWTGTLGRVATKDCAIVCRRWFESWNSIDITPIVVAMLAGLNSEYVGCHLPTFFHDEVDCRHHCGKFSIKLLLPILHCAIVALLGDQWVGECWLMHCLNFLYNLLSSWGLG